MTNWEFGPFILTLQIVHNCYKSEIVNHLRGNETLIHNYYCKQRSKMFRPACGVVVRSQHSDGIVDLGEDIKLGHLRGVHRGAMDAGVSHEEREKSLFKLYSCRFGRKKKLTVAQIKQMER